MSSIDAYEREELLLSNRTRLTRNVFFALTTSRDQANASQEQGRTNTSELGFVEKPPKFQPRNVYIARNLGRHAPQVNAQSAVAADEEAVQRLQMQLDEQNEAEKPVEEKPEEVIKRHTSTLGAPGVTISKLPRFGSAGSQRPGSATTSGGGNNDTARSSNPALSGLTTPRRPNLTPRQAQIEQDKENGAAAQREAALHPTRFVLKEIQEYKEKVADMSVRPSFGLPPPRPGSARASSSSSRPTSAKHGGHGGDGEGGEDTTSSPPPLQDGIGLPRAKDFILPWEREVTEKRKVGPVDTAAMDGGPSSWLEPTYVSADGHIIFDDDDAKRKADAEWHEHRNRILDNFGLLQGTRSADSAKKRAGLSDGPNTIVNMVKQVSRSQSVSYHARTTEHHDLFYDHSDAATGKGGRHTTHVRMDKYSKRGGNDVKPFFYVPDDLLKSDHLMRTHRGMVERERNNFVRLLTDATEEELKIMKQHEKEAATKRNEIDQIKLMMSAAQSGAGGGASAPTVAGSGARAASASLSSGRIGRSNGGSGGSSSSSGGTASAAAAAELRKKEAELAALEMDPIKVARCEAAKTFLKQFTPPDSVDVPGLPIAPADDARFNDGFTTTTRARPKTSGESIVTRKFKGAPTLGSYSDRPNDDFSHEFGTQYHVTRKAAAKEVDAMLNKANLRQRMKM